jgi:hypothetical protein
VEHRLLATIDEGVVELPREVGLLLRRDGALGPLHPEPPAPAGTQREPSQVDDAGAGQAMSVVQHAQDLIEALATESAPMLRMGGLGVLQWRRLAKAAAVSEVDAALLIETAYAAGLIGELESSTDTVYAPAGRLRPVAQRAAPTALGPAGQCLARDATTARAGRQARRTGPADDRPFRTAGSGIRARPTPHGAHGARGTVPTGSGTGRADRIHPLAGAEADAGTRGVLSRHPPRGRRVGAHGPGRDHVVHAGTAGVADRGRRRSPGPAPEAELPPEETPAVVMLSALLPAPVDHVLVQADLTVVVPGPAEPALASELELMAEPESGGGRQRLPDHARERPQGARRGIYGP